MDSSHLVNSITDSIATIEAYDVTIAEFRCTPELLSVISASHPHLIKEGEDGSLFCGARINEVPNRRGEPSWDLIPSGGAATLISHNSAITDHIREANVKREAELKKEIEKLNALVVVLKTMLPAGVVECVNLLTETPKTEETIFVPQEVGRYRRP